MKWTGLNELREKYLSFFESKGHLRLPSFSLVPNQDKSLLLINSGMAPMKKYFTGEVTPPRNRVTTCQKCIRTPDIERVGITARHGTYFEMLGNFSFGDYFKNEATAWAWEFFTEVLEMPIEKLYVSIYEQDDEAFDIWTKKIGVAPDHMVRLGKEDNFWEHGTGPCGPCSEIYFDRGEEKGCGEKTCAVGCECDRFVEVWNLVFTQFESDGKNNYTPLEHPNIDTGMGLERLACVMQDVENLFLVDTVKAIIEQVQKITGVKYGEDDKKDISLRVITDHIRSTTFMIGDGVMPSNEGRGYVLRRLLRRAVRHGRLLGVKDKIFLSELCQTVIELNKDAYPELLEKKDFIIKLIKTEEENFIKTIEQGFTMLHEIINNSEIQELSGEDAFKLNDTYGFPLDLTKEILQEKGIEVNEIRFNELMQEQKKRAKNARKNAGADAWISDTTDISDISATEFLGYENSESDAKVLAIIKEGKRETSAYANDDVVLVFEKTPFYAESGGQIGDTGSAKTANAEVEINNTVKNPTGVFLHTGRVKTGMITVGEVVKAQIDKERREDITRNHTAAHLLQAGLREVLGTHVEQAGQLVTDEKFRFDFTHFSPMTAKELLDVEELVNKKIFESIQVIMEEMNIEDAKKIGAMALFGEKYGDVVRVVKADDFSIELCGGTHVDNTSKIGMFKIMSEQSVAAGVRRIEACTGKGVLRLINQLLTSINDSAQILKINAGQFVKNCESVATEIKNKDRQIDELNSKLTTVSISPLIKASKIEKGVRIISSVFTDVSTELLRQMCDKVLEQGPKAVVTVVSIKDGKATFACACGKEARERGAHAGNIVKAVSAIAGGKGGGKPDMAMAGAKDITKVDEAIVAVKQIVLDMVKDEE